MESTDPVITGIGVVSSIGIGREAFTESLRLGHSGICDLSRVDPAVIPDVWVGPTLTGSGAAEAEPALRLGGPILDFEGKQFVKPRKALKVMCREIQTSFAASQLAIDDAGLDSHLPPMPSSSGESSLSADRIGTVFGSEMLYGQPSELADAFERCCDSEGRVDQSLFGNAAMQQITPLWMLKYLPNMPACHVGIAIGAHGPNNTVTLGDVSGPSAVMESCGYLQRGIADVMVTAGCGSRMNQTRSVFTEDQPLTAGQASIDRSSRPHARDADGLVRGEAAAAMIVETRQSANAGGRPIQAIIAGSASRFVASNAFRTGNRTKHTTADAGRGSEAAMVRAMEAAMRQASVTASDIGLLVSHAMGDPVIDAAERAAIARIVPGVPLTLPISLFGHTGAASGMMEMAVGVTALTNQWIPPVPHASECCDGLNVSDQSRPLTKNVVMVLTHTSPGAATAVILKS